MSSGDTLLNGRYRLISQQGSGGMAVIYKATDQALGRTVAIKILRPSLTHDPSFLSRFRNEARAVANLSHPNIVTVHDVGSDGATQYIVMEYVEGQDLKKIIRTEGVMSVGRALDLAIQICAGIGFAHRAGLVHADVKPQNILVTRDNGVKVTDFGIAQALTDTQPLQRQEVVWGSPHYFAPEQARGEKPSPASDVYAIGIVMFEMLTGRLPYIGGSQQELALAHLREKVPMVSEVNPSVPESLSRIVYKVMSKEPSARYRMADQLGHILESYRQRSREHTAQHNNFPPPPPLPPRESSPPPMVQPPPRPAQPTVPHPVSTSPPPPTQRTLPISEQTVRNTPSPPASQPAESYPPGIRPPWEPPQPTPSAPPRQNAPVSPPADDSRRFYPLAPGDSRPYIPPPQSAPRNAPPPVAGLDLITIALAGLAFMSVACLIPLYIAVFQSRFGG